MSGVTRAAFAVGLALRLSWAESAWAEPRSSGLRWNLDTRVGYANSWNTAQTYLGVGTGLAAGVTFRVPIHVEVEALYHVGSTVSAANASLDYWSRTWSVLGHVTAGYELPVLGVVVRPQVLAGCAVLADKTFLGDDARRSVNPMFTVGPGLALLVRFGRLHAGVDGRTLYVPSRIAAPIGGVYAVFGGDL